MLQQFIYHLTAEVVKSNKKKEYDLRFQLLEGSPYLHSSEYLNELYDSARSKKEYGVLLDHIYKSEAEEIDSYKEIEQKIIEKYR